MQGKVNVRMIPIPDDAHTKRKGTTKYDEHFEKLMDFKEAMQVPENDFSLIRKAITRFLTFRGLTDSVSVRQMKDHRTKTYLIWLANEPPLKRSKA